MTTPTREQDIAGIDDLNAGESLTFTIDCHGHRVAAFLINHDGQIHAYVNRCRHVPITLDWAENRFFTEDGRYILCANHGAYYEPTTGECVAGPPCGQSLFRVPLRVENGRILVRCPPEIFEA